MASSSEGAWWLKSHGLCPIYAIYCGGVIAWSALRCFAHPWKWRNIASSVMAVSIKLCLVEAWHLPEPTPPPPNKWVNVTVESSGEVAISMLCVGLSDFWKDGFNMKKQSSFKEMKLKWHTKVAGLLGICTSLKTQGMFGLVMQQPLFNVRAAGLCCSFSSVGLPLEVNSIWANVLLGLV